MSKVFYDQIPPETGRKYSIMANPDNTSSIVDVTQYVQEGTAWSAADANEAMRKEDYAPLRFTNTVVNTSSWNADATYADFPRRKSVALTGVTAAMVPDVVLAPADATGGNIAPVAVAYNGGIYLYAKETPTARTCR